MKKISFIGDIMCEPMLLKASKINKGYNFDGVFEYIRDFLKESDYVVANLETPIAGEQLGFTSSLFEFNAPIEFLDALKDAGINLVTTANNHSL
ncbi:MAG: CapA family protein, partial [Finegoldia magna]|nr:CapA family protein [Finegoldia magna]